jgi:hypothetical protein
MATQTENPNTFTSLNNAQLSNNINDVSTDDLNYVVNAGNNGDVQALFGFPTVTAGTGNLGTGTQTFNVILQTAAGVNAIDYDIVLYENGTAIQTLVSRTGNAISGGTVADVSDTATWTVGGLTTPLADGTGANVEVGIIQTNGGTGRAANRNFLYIDFVEWVINAEDAISPGKSQAVWI